MNAYSPAVDAYIEKAAPFAQPILSHIRELVHRVCPEVEEKMKWSFPCFDYKGRIMCSMAAFKQHCTFGFWNASLLPDPNGLLQPVGQESMGNFGKLHALADLPADAALEAFLRAHMIINEQGIKPTKAVAKPVDRNLEVPADLIAALATNPAAQATFDAFSFSNRKEYLEWIAEAKTDATRAKRLSQAVEWMAEGKSRNWKYQRA